MIAHIPLCPPKQSLEAPAPARAQQVVKSPVQLRKLVVIVKRKRELIIRTLAFGADPSGGNLARCSAGNRTALSPSPLPLPFGYSSSLRSTLTRREML